MIEKGICCVCGHKLSSHIDEDNGWRCHSLGPDAYQCECFLRKDRAGKEGINYYDLKIRTAKMVEESRE